MSLPVTPLPSTAGRTPVAFRTPLEALESRSYLSASHPVAVAPAPAVHVAVSHAPARHHRQHRVHRRHHHHTVTAPAPTPAPSPAGSLLHLTNGGFETMPPLAGWTVAGNATVHGDDFMAPPEGSAQAVVSTNSAGGTPVSAAALESFLSVENGTLGSETTGPAVNGSAILQSFTAHAGDTLPVTYDFLTNETAQGTADFAFFTLTANGKTQIYKVSDALTDQSILDQQNTQFARHTGQHTYTFTLPADGTYTVGFGVANVGDASGASALVVDNV